MVLTLIFISITYFPIKGYVETFTDFWQTCLPLHFQVQQSTHQYTVIALSCIADTVHANAFKVLLIKIKFCAFHYLLTFHESQIYWLPDEMNTVCEENFIALVLFEPFTFQEGTNQHCLGLMVIDLEIILTSILL